MKKQCHNCTVKDKPDYFSKYLNYSSMLIVVGIFLYATIKQFNLL